MWSTWLPKTSYCWERRTNSPSRSTRPAESAMTDATWGTYSTTCSLMQWSREVRNERCEDREGGWEPIVGGAYDPDERQHPANVQERAPCSGVLPTISGSA